MELGARGGLARVSVNLLQVFFWYKFLARNIYRPLRAFLVILNKVVEYNAIAVFIACASGFSEYGY